MFIASRAYGVGRQFLLHTSCGSFAADFCHAAMGHYMIFADQFERVREPLITFATLAAVLIVYMDDHHHRAAALRARRGQPIVPPLRHRRRREGARK